MYKGIAWVDCWFQWILFSKGITVWLLVMFVSLHILLNLSNKKKNHEQSTLTDSIIPVTLYHELGQLMCSYSMNKRFVPLGTWLLLYLSDKGTEIWGVVCTETPLILNHPISMWGKHGCLQTSTPFNKHLHLSLCSWSFTFKCWCIVALLLKDWSWQLWLDINLLRLYA